MEKVRIAFIVINFAKNNVIYDDIYAILDKFKGKILDKKHIFDKKDQKYIISILAKVTTDELGAITGPLGKLKGIKFKSGVLPE